MENGTYFRVWKTHTGNKKSRLYLVKADRVFDLRQARWSDLTCWDHHPGYWLWCGKATCFDEQRDTA